MSDTIVYNIPESNYELLLAKIEKMSRRANKLGRSVPVVSVVGQHAEVVNEKKGITRNIIEVTINAEPIKVDGWEFIASIDVSDDPEIGRVIRRVPGAMKDVDLPHEYRNATGVCEHCNKNRRRNGVYILYNAKLNEWKQVGRNCLADFLGGCDPEEYIKYMQFFINLDDLCSGSQNSDYFGVGGADYRLDIRSVLTFTNFVIDKFGWLSRSKSRELSEEGVYKMATSGYVKDFYTISPAYRSPTISNLARDFDNLSAEELIKFNIGVDEAIDWIRSTDDELNNDYLHNLYVCCYGDTIDKKHIGLVCSLVIAYKSAMGLLEKRERMIAKSNHVGVVGDKIELQLKVVDKKLWQNNYGGVDAIFFEDESGNKLIWKATNSPRIDIDSTYNVKGTIKKHSDYKGLLQTELTRCKFSLLESEVVV